MGTWSPRALPPHGVGGEPTVGRLLLDLGEPAEAAAVAAWGLAIDRYCDGLWKLMIAAHDQGSNQAASARTRNDYRRVLAELGVGQDVP